MGVDPWYFWVDREPTPKQHVAIPAGYAKQWGPPAFKYRGWFINDEDLLGWFAPAPLQDGVFSLEMWDRIYETLLRLRANTVIPGTFTFPDERMQVLAARRGLINSQHHICVVGLNTFQWPKEFPYSYRTHPGTLEQAWQVCVDALKDREAVWTVGFRGRHDRAFWADDPEVKTPEARGKLISDAIARQVEMVRRAQPNADCIANLWVEGVELYKAGHLKLPPGVILVWPDDGAGLIRDRGEARSGQGIYYHTAMLSGRHSQLTEIVPPRRIHQEMSRFIKAGATSCFVVNVSDVRPVPLSTDYCMRMAWSAGSELEKTSTAAERDCLVEWSRRQFGDADAESLAPLYGAYFATPYIQAGLGENKSLREIQRLVELTRAAAAPGKMPVNLARSTAAEFAPSTAHLAELAPKVRAMVPRVPAERRDFYVGHLLLQVEVHHRLCNVLQALCAAIIAMGNEHSEQAIDQLDEALARYDALIQALRNAEYGRWKGCYAGERFTEVMVCPVLAPLGRISGRPALGAQAARQLEIFSDQLRDPRSGLFYHMWDEETGRHSPCFWGRGNGRVAMSYVEVLKNAPADSPDRPRLVDACRKLLGALAPLQDRQTGLWHTVLDDPASYAETSASAMILYSMIEGQTMHLLDADYDEPIQRAWAALSTQVDNMGQVIGVSAGTGPGERGDYLTRPRGTYTWGTGAMLMAACARAEIERSR